MATDIDTILKLDVPVIVTIGERQMSLEDILSMVPGAIIELDKPSDEPLGLMINNKPIGEGLAVKVGENFGIRVTAVGSAEQRVQALGLG
jgi:flagellar motor switch protein FliN/FliY